MVKKTSFINFRSGIQARFAHADSSVKTIYLSLKEGLYLGKYHCRKKETGGKKKGKFKIIPIDWKKYFKKIIQHVRTNEPDDK